MSRVNETRFLVQHESCKCKCRLNEYLCNSKQKWNHDKCRCECKEVDNWGSCKKEYMWNPARVIVSIIKHVKLTNIWILKIVLAKNVLLVS